MSSARAIWALPALTVLACGGEGAPTGEVGDAAVPAALSSCDPFAPEPLPITLGTLVAAGRDSAGVIYAVDHGDGSESGGERVFVSDGSGALVRQRIAGSGIGSDFYVFSVTDHDPAFVLQIDTPPGGPLRMGVVIGTLKDSKTFVIGEQGEELTVLPDAALAGVPVRNLPGTMVLEYAASLPSGDVIVVTRPRDDGSYEDFRLFLGGVDAVTERRVTTVTRMRDGGTTSIWFELDGRQAEAHFPVIFVDGGFAPGPASLITVGTTTPLARQDAAPADAQYLCLLGGEVAPVYDGGVASDSADSPLGDAGVADAGAVDAVGSPDVLLCAPGWCREGECVMPPGCEKLSCGSPPGRTYCGLIGDSCGGVLDCSPTCPQPGWICNADHQCKTPLGLCSDLACEMNGVQYCGPLSDACGTIVCSTTCKQPGWECVDGRCVDPACLPPACEWPPPPVSHPFPGEWAPAPPLPEPCVAPVSP